MHGRKEKRGGQGRPVRLGSVDQPQQQLMSTSAMMRIQIQLLSKTLQRQLFMVYLRNMK